MDHKISVVDVLNHTLVDRARLGDEVRTHSVVDSRAPALKTKRQVCEIQRTYIIYSSIIVRDAKCRDANR